MRKITKLAIAAFENDMPFKSGNTEIFVDTFSVKMYLHGNLIAEKSFKNPFENSDLYIDTCGWNTPTTKERLNGIHGVNIYQHKGTLYLNEKEWNGNRIKVY